MTENKMYSQRAKQGNIPVMRYCGFGCVYCAFQKFQKISSCKKCRAGENHSHMEVLQRTPPKTKPGEFLTIGLSGDMSFMNISDFKKVIEYCAKWGDRMFLIQSKDPTYFVAFEENGFSFPDNVILGTTIETNDEYPYNAGSGVHTSYRLISKAPLPEKRYEAMLKLNCRMAITIEPILDFDIDIFGKMILSKHWDFVYIGYANDGKEGKRLRLPEPELQKVYALIDRLKRNCYGTEIRIKTLRPAWYEEI